MTIQHWKWSLTTGALLAMSPASLDASEPEATLPRSSGLMQNATPAAQLPPPGPVAHSVFTEETPQPLPSVVNPPPAPQAACQAGRPASFLQRCKHRMQECFLGFPERFEGAPFGSSIAMHYQAHVANGDAARMVLYQYDFVANGEQLNLRGKDRLAQIAAMLPQNGFPIVIERTPMNPTLAETRRKKVLHELAQGTFPVPPERVVIGAPLATGLSGRESLLIYGNLLTQTQDRGSAILTTGGATGGIGGGGQGGLGAGAGGLGGGTPR